LFFTALYLLFENASLVYLVLEDVVERWGGVDPAPAPQAWPMKIEELHKAS
jgi:hypothetical protein